MNDIEILKRWEDCKDRLERFSLDYKIDKFGNGTSIYVQRYGMFDSILELYGFLVGYEYYYNLSKNRNFIKAYGVEGETNG